MPLAASSISSPFSPPECLDRAGGYGLLYVYGFFCFVLVLFCIAFFFKIASSTLFRLLLVAKNINKSGVCLA